jgi:hypothetical protein
MKSPCSFMVGSDSDYLSDNSIASLHVLLNETTILTSFLFVGCLSNNASGFAPTVRSKQRLIAIASHKVEANAKSSSDSKTPFCIPLEEIVLDDLPKLGG